MHVVAGFVVAGVVAVAADVVVGGVLAADVVAGATDAVAAVAAAVEEPGTGKNPRCLP